MHASSVSLTIRVPSEIADEGAAELARTLLVLDAVRCERLSWRAAAAALEIAPDQLLDLARAHEIPVIHLSAADLEADLETLDQLTQTRDAGA